MSTNSPWSLKQGKWRHYTEFPPDNTPCLCSDYRGLEVRGPGSGQTLPLDLHRGRAGGHSRHHLPGDQTQLKHWRNNQSICVYFLEIRCDVYYVLAGPDPVRWQRAHRLPAVRDRPRHGPPHGRRLGGQDLNGGGGNLPNLRHSHGHKCQMFWEMKDSELGNFLLPAAMQWVINFQVFNSENTRYCHVQIVSQNNSCDHVV